jgi:putative glutamine amidotransferase
MPEPKPLVLVPACNRILGDHDFHVAGRKYVDAVRLAGCQPLVVPNLQEGELEPLLDLAHGVLLTGSPANVHPSHFGESVHDESLPLDPRRDALTLGLIPKALARGMPLFAICRGTQEVNVALGGSLHQAVHEVAPFADHRERPDVDLDEQYGDAHEVTVEPGGLLDGLLAEKTFVVNSLHGQAVNRLADGLRIEARAHDGLVEAYSAPNWPGFTLCLQWHPEWRAERNPVSMQLLGAFGQACRAYRQRRASPP